MDEHFDKIQKNLKAGIAYSQKQIDTYSTTQTTDVFKSVPTPQIITAEKNTSFETTQSYSQTYSEEKNTSFDRQERHIILGFTSLCLLEITFKLIYILG